MRDISTFLGLSGPSVAFYNLTQLELKGLVRRFPQRSIAITDAGKALLAEARA